MPTAISYAEESVLAARSCFIRPGVRRQAKESIARRERRSASSRKLSEMLTREQMLEAMADDFLASHEDSTLTVHVAVEEESDHQEFPLDVGADGEFLSKDRDLLAAVLPESVLSQLDAENGSAFGHLSLFEAKSCATPARFYRDDDAAYE